MTDLNWEDLRTILVLVEEGTLAGAGSRLNLSYTTVARRIGRAETTLGRPLFERHPEGYIPLDEARAIAEAAQRMKLEEDGLMRRLAGQDRGMSGALVFTAPQLLIQTHLAPVLAAFTDRYPNIQLTVKASYGILDLARREADLAVRIMRKPQDTLIGRILCEQQAGFFAAPDLAEKLADDPVAWVDWLLYSGQSEVPEDIGSFHPNIRVRARFDDMAALIAAAEEGMGVLRMPLFLGRSSAGLVELSHLPRHDYPPLWLLNHKDLQASGKVRALKDMLISWAGDKSSDFLG